VTEVIEKGAAGHPAARSELRELSDGTVVTSRHDGTPFLVRAGRREQILNPTQLSAHGIDPREIRPVELAAGELAAIPLDGVLALGATGVRPFDSGDVFLDAGHFMRTWGTLDLATGQVAASTRTRTVTWFGGYHGAVHLIFADGADAPVWSSPSHRYGVDGTVVGQSDRTDAWWETMKPADTPRVSSCYIFQGWDPDGLIAIIDRAVAVGKAVGELAREVAEVAKVVAVVFG
jgi:hypothetical protein